MSFFVIKRNEILIHNTISMKYGVNWKKQTWRVTWHDSIYINYSKEVKHGGSHFVIPAFRRTKQKVV